MAHSYLIDKLARNYLGFLSIVATLKCCERMSTLPSFRIY